VAPKPGSIPFPLYWRERLKCLQAPQFDSLCRCPVRAKRRHRGICLDQACNS